jgi:hypothetical protein
MQQSWGVGVKSQKAGLFLKFCSRFVADTKYLMNSYMLATTIPKEE